LGFIGQDDGHDALGGEKKHNRVSKAFWRRYLKRQAKQKNPRKSEWKEVVIQNSPGRGLAQIAQCRHRNLKRSPALKKKAKRGCQKQSPSEIPVNNETRVESAQTALKQRYGCTVAPKQQE